MAEKNFTDFPQHVWKMILDGLDQEIARSESKSAELRRAAPRNTRAISEYEGDARKARELKESFIAEMG